MLVVKGLSKAFTLKTLGNKRIEGFRDVDFHLPEGQFLGLAGPSGSGKSSILKCVYRTYLPTEGAIWYHSSRSGAINLSEAPEHTILKMRESEIGYVSQFLKVVPRVSSVDVVAEPLVRGGVSPDTARKRASDLLERLLIPGQLFDASPLTFSGGEQQRINIARAVIWKPRLLLLDEPTASLDTGSIRSVLDLLKELRSSGTSMIGIFHDTSLMDSTADTIYNLKNGGDTHAA